MAWFGFDMIGTEIIEIQTNIPSKQKHTQSQQ